MYENFGVPDPIDAFNLSAVDGLYLKQILSKMQRRTLIRSVRACKEFQRQIMQLNPRHTRFPLQIVINDNGRDGFGLTILGLRNSMLMGEPKIVKEFFQSVSFFSFSTVRMAFYDFKKKSAFLTLMQPLLKGTSKLHCDRLHLAFSTGRSVNLNAKEILNLTDCFAFRQLTIKSGQDVRTEMLECTDPHKFKFIDDIELRDVHFSLEKFLPHLKDFKRLKISTSNITMRHKLVSKAILSLKTIANRRLEWFEYSGIFFRFGQELDQMGNVSVSSKNKEITIILDKIENGGWMSLKKKYNQATEDFTIEAEFYQKPDKLMEFLLSYYSPEDFTQIVLNFMRDMYSEEEWPSFVKSAIQKYPIFSVFK